MREKITIGDVARKAGVSPSTVSRVLNNAPNVAEHTRFGVYDAVRGLAYGPDRTPKALVLGRERSSGGSGDKSENRSPVTRTKEKHELLCFEGKWEAKECNAIQRAIFRSQTEATPWLCVKTRFEGTSMFIAIRRHRSRKMVIAGTARDLSTRILSQEGIYLSAGSSTAEPG